jgi:hypothetical protein
MKKVILLVTLVPYIASGQLIENFETGNLVNWTQGVEGRWKADTVSSIGGLFSLHHVYDNQSPGSDCIGRSLADLQPSEGLTRWSFTLRHGCDPSASNSWAVYLMSDRGPGLFDNGNSASGYAAGVNLAGYDDTLRLWKISGGRVSAAAACPVNWQNDLGVAAGAVVVVERTPSGRWTISALDTAGNLKGTASVGDNQLFSSNWLVLNYRYTATRDRLIWMDDLRVEGVFRTDKEPPAVIDCKVSGQNRLDITLDEEPSENCLTPSSFLIDEGGNAAIDIQKICQSTIRVSFTACFKNKVLNTLKISGLCDTRGNCSDTLAAGFTPSWAETGDVIISEIMADPLPPVSLPADEYLELFNRTGFEFNMNRWKIVTDNQQTVFPAFIIKPGEHLIACSVADTSSFSRFGRVVGLKSFPFLTVSGKSIALTDSSGGLIHGVKYSSTWYGSALKSGGGWSLEIVDAGFPFFETGNWKASASRNGGTPGRVNSISRYNPDTYFRGVKNVFPTDSVTLNATFSETVTCLMARAGEITAGGQPVSSAATTDALCQDFIFKTGATLTPGEVYSLVIPDDVTDFAGNQISTCRFSFGLTEPASRGDVMFNELLFNPPPGEPDFIELINLSGKIIDASALFLVSINAETGDTSVVLPVSEENRCIVPGSLYATTTDRDAVTGRYFCSSPDNIFNVSSLPSMSDDRGHLVLLNREMDVIDEVIYNDEMHYSLLSGREGISLEKIRPELPSCNGSSWHSASEASGWATPGLENSVFIPGPSSADRIQLSSGRISPDNDGYEDILVIDMDLEGSGNIVSITVFDETGNRIRKLADTFYAGSRASVTWDATAHDGSLVQSGIYIILIELYNDKGRVKSWKKVCTVLR